MKRDNKLLFKLFKSTFFLSAFTFGGGYVIVPLMRKKFVDELKWIDEKEMMDFIAIAQSSPGPIAINTSILLGYRVAGFFGSVLTILGTILPPLIIISTISMFYEAFKNNVVVSAVLMGMQAGVAAVILDVVIGMATNIVKLKKPVALVIMIGAFISTYFFKINIILIILSCGTLGVLYTSYFRKRGEGK